jgi:hypothetical protein
VFHRSPLLLLLPLGKVLGVPVAWEEVAWEVMTMGVGYRLDWTHFQVGFSKARIAGWRTGAPRWRPVLRSSWESSVGAWAPRIRCGAASGAEAFLVADLRLAGGVHDGQLRGHACPPLLNPVVV